MRCVAAPSFAELTTLRLGGRAIALACPATVQDLEGLPSLLKQEGGQPFMLGNGSNLLAHDGELPLVLVHWDAQPTLNAVAEKDRVRIRAGASVPLPRLVAFATARGCTELAGLAGIPGQVGGAMAMNAGSYSVEFARLVRACTIFTPEHGLLRLEADTGFAPGYRHTNFHLTAPWYLIVEVELDVKPNDRSEALALVRERIRRKAITQPVRAKSAGCIFKNPTPAASDLSAGKLLEAAGFRGKTLGGVGFSTLHANFLVNHGHGTATEALLLMDQAQNAVAAQFGVALETEVRVLAC